MKLITYNGKTQSMKAWAAELNINYQTAHSRMRSGKSIDVALAPGRAARSPNHNAAQITHEGKSQTIRQWAAEKALPLYIIYQRRHAGWSVADMLNSPVSPRAGRKSPRRSTK